MPRAGLDPEIVTEAAANIVGAEGLAALTLARLAATLGVAPPSLYKHVGGLEDLTVRVTTLAIRRLADGLVAAAIGRSDGQALHAIAQAYRRFATDHGGLYLLTQAAPHSTSAEQGIEVGRALGVFSAISAGYGIPEDRSVHAVRLIRSGLHGFADIEARRGFQMAACVDETFHMLVEALDTSLRSLGGGIDLRAGGLGEAPAANGRPAN